MSNYLSFPARETILQRLGELGGVTPERRDLYLEIADRLASHTYDSAAFAFLLIELVHRHEEALGEDRASFIPRCVLALTRDRELARAARQAYAEVRPETS